MPLTQVSSRLIEDTLRYVLGASGTNHYTFTGKGLTGAVNDPTLTLSRGHTYIFENRNSSGAHPFYIKTSIANGGTNDAYNTGVTNNGGAGGTEIVFTVPHDAPDLLYYQCSSHSSMAGQLKIAGSIEDGSITTAKLANNSVTFEKLEDVSSGRIVGRATGGDGDAEELTASQVRTILNVEDGATAASGISDVVSDTTPQLGGNLDTNNNSILLNDSNGTTNRILLGTASDMRIFHDGTTSRIDDLNGTDIEIRANDIRLQSNANVGAKSALNCNANAAVELFYNDVKQLETTENGILLPKGVIRGLGGSKVIIGGTLDPSQDRTWSFSFGTNDNGYNQGYVFNIKFYVNHWNTGGSYKYIESISGGRGNVTGLERVDLINNLGTAGSSWQSGHLDYSVSLTGGTRNGSGVSLFNVTYDADGAPSWTSGYYLEVNYSNQIGTITIT